MNKKGFTLLELLILILTLSISTIIIVTSIIKTNNNFKKDNYNLAIKVIEKTLQLEVKNNPDFKLVSCTNKVSCMNVKENNRIFELSNISNYDIIVSRIDYDNNKYIIELKPTDNGKYSGINLDNKEKIIRISK